MILFEELSQISFLPFANFALIQDLNSMGQFPKIFIKFVSYPITNLFLN